MFETVSEDADYSFTAARNMALDSEGNLYVFDYMDNFIKKFDQSGKHAVTFGGQGEGEGQFSHLMDIRIFGDRLMALDSPDVDVDQVKWVVLMVLFSQPGQESAFARMEDLVFEEDAGIVH